MKVLITGDSHTGPLAQGLHLLRTGDTPPDPSLQIHIRALGGGQFLPTPFFADRGDHAELVEPDYRKRFTRLPPAQSDLDWIGFSGPLHTNRIWREDWSTHKPWQQGEGQAVSGALLRRVVDDDLAHSLAFLTVLRRTHRIFVIASPWPFGNTSPLRRNGAATVGLVHQAYRTRAMAQLAAQDIPVVDIDPAWADEDGLMRPEFRHDDPKDPHHGNREFGRRMMQRVIDFLEAAPAAS